MSNNIALDNDIENGEWPDEFSGAWIYVFYDPITTDVVACLFFDGDFPQGTVIEGYSNPISLPAAYISWKQNGECREIFVSEEYRRRGIGTKLCAWARSYTYNNENFPFCAPNKMSIDAQLMYQHISSVYDEPYNDPEDFPPNIRFPYWGGYLV